MSPYVPVERITVGESHHRHVCIKQVSIRAFCVYIVCRDRTFNVAAGGGRDGGGRRHNKTRRFYFAYHRHPFILYDIFAYCLAIHSFVSRTNWLGSPSSNASYPLLLILVFCKATTATCIGLTPVGRTGKLWLHPPFSLSCRCLTFSPHFLLKPEPVFPSPKKIIIHETLGKIFFLLTLPTSVISYWCPVSCCDTSTPPCRHETLKDKNRRDYFLSSMI